MNRCGFLAALSAWFLLDLVLFAQDRIDSGDPFHQPCQPPPTLISGEETAVEITAGGTVTEGEIRCRNFRYGALSDGPVLLTISSKKPWWALRATDAKGNLLIELDGKEEKAPVRKMINVKAGDEILISIVGTRTPGLGLRLMVTLTEKHRAAGEKSIDDAVERAKDLLSRSQEEKDARKTGSALQFIRQALAAVRRVPGSAQSGKAAAALTRIGKSAYGQRDYKTALAAYEAVYRLYERLYHEDHAELQDARLHLAYALKKTGDYRRAREFGKKVVEVYQRTLDPDRRELQKARLSLAYTLNKLGDHQGARDLEAKALEVFEQTLDADDPDLPFARGNLAWTLCRLGEYQKARVLQEKVLEFRRRYSDRNHPALLRSLQSLAEILRNLGDEKNMVPLEKEIVEFHERNGSPDDKNLQLARLNLAITLKSLEQDAAAMALEKEALNILEKTCDEEDLGLQVARGNYASTLRNLGHLDKARELQEKVLAVRTKKLADNNPDLQRARHGLALTLLELGEYQRARELQEEVVRIYEQIRSPGDAGLEDMRLTLIKILRGLDDLPATRDVQEKILKANEGSFPYDHPRVNKARSQLLKTLKALGDLRGIADIHEKLIGDYENDPDCNRLKFVSACHAFAVPLKKLGEYQRAADLEKKAIELLAAASPPDNYYLQTFRLNYAWTISQLGDLRKARKLDEETLETLSKTRPPLDPELQRARLNLAWNLKKLGDLHGALELEKKAVEACLQIGEDHYQTQKARNGLAWTIKELGDLEGALEMQKQVLQAYERTPPSDDSDLQWARLNMAITLKELRQAESALELEEKALAAFEKNLAPRHPDLLKARLSHAYTLCQSGDLYRARTTQEDILAIYEETLGREFPDHPELQRARTALAGTISTMGDLKGAQILYEKVLEVRLRVLDPDSPSLQEARNNLGANFFALGRYEEARKLFEEALEVKERIFPPSHPGIRFGRMNLANAMHCLGDLDEALILHKETLEAFERDLPKDHPDLQRIRLNLAAVLVDLDRLDEARDLYEGVLASREELYPQGHPDLQRVRLRLASVLTLFGEEERARGLTRKALEGTRRFLARLVTKGSVREMDECTSKNRWILDRFLSLAGDGAPSAEEKFLAAEDFRAAGAKSGLIRRIIAREGGEKIKRLQEELAVAGLEVAHPFRKSFYAAIMARERIEWALGEEVENLDAARRILTERGVMDIAAALPRGWAAISIFRYGDHARERQKAEKDSLFYLAHVLDRSGKVVQVPLGRAEEIEAAAEAWREALLSGGDMRLSLDNGLREKGRKLRELVWDPLTQHFGRAEGIVLAPDAMLATLPLEALPERNGVLADRYTITYVNSLSTLAIPNGTDRGGDATLVSFGGIDYDSEPRLYTGTLPEWAEWETEPQLLACAEQRSTPRGDEDIKVKCFAGMTMEAREVASLFSNAFGKEAIRVEGAEASKASLRLLAPRAQFLHIATHGYFAPESMRFLNDWTPSGGSPYFSTIEEKITGLAPSLLCGLRLAGCNLPLKAEEDKGIITADEIQGLNLDRCELAVLSACETNVGLVRAGQGIMSLQRALGIAGARGTITSLWKVYDKPTRLLFNKFYHLLWDEGLPPAKALRMAKLWLRTLTKEQVDELVQNLPDAGGRGDIRKREPRTASDSAFPYESPGFWASFVYWGELEGF